MLPQGYCWFAPDILIARSYSASVGSLYDCPLSLLTLGVYDMKVEPLAARGAGWHPAAGWQPACWHVVRSRPGRLTIGRRLNNLPHKSARQPCVHDTLGFRGVSKRIELASAFMSRTPMRDVNLMGAGRML